MDQLGPDEDDDAPEPYLAPGQQPPARVDHAEGQLEGNGWSEDNSCILSSLYLSENHPILSGFDYWAGSNHNLVGDELPAP